jgi:hypothetical protein
MKIVDLILSDEINWEYGIKCSGYSYNMFLWIDFDKNLTEPK